MNKITLNILVPLIYVFSIGCDQHAQNISNIKIIDSGMYSGYPHDWLDNHRIIFSSRNLGPNNKRLDQESYYIRIWDITKGVTDYKTMKPVPQGPTLCFRNGNVYYPVRYFRDENSNRMHQFMYGPFGEERIYVTPDLDLKKVPREREWSQLNCKILKKPESHKTRWWVPLMEDDGYLEDRPGYNRASNKHPINYYSIHTNESVEIPMYFYKLAILDIRYYAFKGAYLLAQVPTEYSNETPNQEDGCGLALWLYPDGKYEKLCIPKVKPSFGRISSVYAIKNKLLVVVKDFRSDTIMGNSGLYLITNGEMKRLIKGRILGVSVSPGGCKIAFSHAKDFTGIPTLKMTDLCR